ncbi:hypothetical protein [Alteromonas flava]|uniref:hypothetical protein n=1 Tax=Alteromonas flava TaxID=2048003 RepID=UPI000C291BD1|nr:hypothetical protein [Alteromonas flava]
MSYGLTCIDQAVAKYGLSAEPCDNQFQRVLGCFGGEVPSVEGKSLPFCIKRFLFQAPLYSQWFLHVLTLPKANKPLACFICDVKGNIVERVYYQNSRKYYAACDRLLNSIKELAEEHRIAA